MASVPTTRSIVRDGIAVGIATGAYGISFGAVSVASGLDVWQSCALSLLVFTGASQFALVGVIGAGGSPLFGAVSGLLLGTRNTLYGLKVAPMLGFRGARKAAAAHLVIDESSAMTLTRSTREHARAGFLSTGSGRVRALEPRHAGRRTRGQLPGRPAQVRPRRGRRWRVPRLCCGHGSARPATGSQHSSAPRSRSPSSP